MLPEGVELLGDTSLRVVSLRMYRRMRCIVQVVPFPPPLMTSRLASIQNVFAGKQASERVCYVDNNQAKAEGY